MDKTTNWQAMLPASCTGTKYKHLGTFVSREAAAIAHDKAVRECGGEEAKCNFSAADAAAWELRNPDKVAPLPRRNTGGFIGIRLLRDRWQARRSLPGEKRKRDLGSFRTQEEAASAYDQDARKAPSQRQKYNFASPEEGQSAVATALANVSRRPAAHAQATALWEHQHPPAEPKSRAKSGFYGVTKDGNKWKAQLKYGGRNHHLGTFDTREQAAAAFDKAAREHRGSTGMYNFESAAAAEASVADAVAAYNSEAAAPAGAAVAAARARERAKKAMVSENLMDELLTWADASHQQDAPLPEVAAAPPLEAQMPQAPAPEPTLFHGQDAWLNELSR